MDCISVLEISNANLQQSHYPAENYFAVCFPLTTWNSVKRGTFILWPWANWNSIHFHRRMCGINPEYEGRRLDGFTMAAKNTCATKWLLLRAQHSPSVLFLLQVSWELTTICDGIGRLSIVSSSWGVRGNKLAVKMCWRLKLTIWMDL